MSPILRTHEMIRDLEGGGFTSQQAEALVDCWTKIVRENSSVPPDTRGINSAFKEFERSMTITIYAGQALFVVAVVFFIFMIHGK